MAIRRRRRLENDVARARRILVALLLACFIRRVAPSRESGILACGIVRGERDHSPEVNPASAGVAVLAVVRVIRSRARKGEHSRERERPRKHVLPQ